MQERNTKLLEDLKTMNQSATARKYNISRNQVYNIIKALHTKGGEIHEVTTKTESI